jgi:hypothetical protein
MTATGATPAREEVSFYSDDSGVRVTNSRLIIGATTYTMLNITSVSCAVERPSRVVPWAFFIVGAFSFLAGFSSRGAEGFIIFGLFMLAIGGLWWKAQKTYYHLRIASASGEASAVKSTDETRVEKILEAVNEAIIGRG